MQLEAITLALDMLASFGVSVWHPSVGGNVVFSHGHSGFGCAEGDFPLAPRLASFKAKIRRQGAASKRPGSIQAACSRWRIQLRFPQERDFSPATRAVPARGRSPRGCSGPGRSGFGARSPAAWPGQEMFQRQISTHSSSQAESE